MIGRLRILLVEDDARSARRLAGMLTEDGFSVDVVHDAATAIAYLEEAPPPDVVVTDLMLPGASGLSVVEHAQRTEPSMPVIFVTAYPELLSLTPSRARPEPLVFTKPLEYDALHAALDRLGGSTPQGLS